MIKPNYSSTLASIKYFILFVSICLLVIGVSYYTNFTNQQRALKTSELSKINLLSDEFYSNLNAPVEDILALSKQPELFTSSNKSKLLEQFKIRMEINNSIYQFRFLDINGQEMVRVNRQGQTILAEPENNLQNKASRYYFDESVNQASGLVYISELDLNVENQVLELPYRPMIRLATPVDDPSNQRVGIILINIDSQIVINSLEKITSENIADYMLVDQYGYWVYHADETKRWGRQLGHRHGFKDAYPGVWESMTTDSLEQTGIESMLLSAVTLRSADSIAPAFRDSLSNNRDWYLISKIDSSELHKQLLATKKQLVPWFILATLFAIPLCVYLGRISAQRNYDAQRTNAFASIIEDNDSIIYICNMSGNIKYANANVTHTYGYTNDEIINANPRIFKSGKHSADYYRRMWQAIAGGEAFEGVFINRTKSGHPIYEHKRIKPIAIHGKNHDHFISIGKNISEVLQEKQYRLNTSSRISGSIQHHFNNLLQAVYSAIQLSNRNLAKGDLDKTASLLEKAELTTSRTIELVKRIGLTGDNQIKRFELVNLETVLQACIDKLEKNNQNNIHIILNVDSDIPLLSLSKETVSESIYAVIDNAYNASAENDEIVITLTSIVPADKFCINCEELIEGTYVSVSVTDHGQGIAKEQLSEIFEPFVSTHENAERVAMNSGLGLTIARAVVHQHGGHLLVDSKKGETNVALLFPIS